MIRPVPSDVEPFEAAAFDAARPACPPSDLFMPAREGTLPQPLRDRVLTHVESCFACRTLIAALESGECTDITGEEAVRIRARIAAARTASRRRWSIAAAAAIVVLGSGLWFAQFQRVRSAPPDAPAPPAAQNAVRPRTFVLALDVPTIELPADALVLRGSESSRYSTALVGALEPFRKGEYLRAAERLDVLIASNPGEPYALYYLGIARLLAGRPLDAVEPLQNAREVLPRDSWLYPNVTWYLAVAFERGDRADQAVILLSELCGSRGSRGEQACGALGTLLAPRVGSNDRVPVPALSLAGVDPLLVQRARRGALRPDR